ncbi:receptor-like protein kinase 7 [Cryptomeria japonica]|uniref:receptor-like protein kinase 7 n=1 Tax=Cryptomeria japonica TaxID=3369 RepID=UPI0025ABBCF9|nr:receptor-like protein kinase 7 [Cryptomeria japonica]
MICVKNVHVDILGFPRRLSLHFTENKFHCIHGLPLICFCKFFFGMALPFRIVFLVIALLGSCYAEDEQIRILLNMKSRVQDPTNALDNWDISSTSPCQWNGITCNNASLVTAINLENTGLIGQISSSICGLSALKAIQLGENSLYGSIADVFWKNCSQLEILNLTTNSLMGSLPDFSVLRSLQVLDLSRNNFSGKFPISVTELSNLHALDLNDNPLDANIIPEEIYSLKDLNILCLSNISLFGTISPSIGNLTELGKLELSYNNLNGTIPKEITRLSKLYQLELYNNFLAGEIPLGFGNLTLLQNFDASLNFLNGSLSELSSLKNLVSLHLYKNQFSGSIPDEFGEFEHLRELSLYLNSLTGPVPQKLGSLSDFSAMDISENLLTGPLPPDVCKRAKLAFLLALQNSFTGGIPESYGNCSTLVRFRISNNSLSGTVPPAIWGLPHAYIIDLSDNNFEGEISRDIENAKNLSVFTIQNNKFSGSIPSEIGQVLLLGKMDASKNQFSGELPNEIGSLTKLSNLLLQQNMLSGAIPDTLGLCTDLSEINLAGNKLNGSIPGSFGSILVLNSLNLSNNQLSGQIPNTLAALQLSLLDFSNNQLTGPVPTPLISLASNHSFSGNKGLCVNGAASVFLSTCAAAPSSSSSAGTHARILIASFISAAAVITFVIGWILYKKMYRAPEYLSWDLKSFHRVTFTEDDILHCLKEENIIGSGGSGRVYKGELCSGEKIAVKQLWNGNTAKLSHLREEALRNRQFEMEVETLGCIRHRNIVKLYCCLSSKHSNLIVYEYMKNGSLWNRLHEENRGSTLDWQTRYKISLGTAYGLAYLHHDCVPAIVHRDVKSSNILLDEDMEPCLADFGVAKCLQASGKGNSTAVIAGTHGYIAPEYAYTYRVSEKSDVYSFGVVLMELVTGKRPMEDEFGENKGIVHWISHKIKSRESAFGVLDKRVSEFCEEGMMKMLKLSVLCTSSLPALRPCMREVVQMLLEADPCCESSQTLIKKSFSCKI